jgi:PBP1b-binding outer membrane lipoprotein LpoB
MKKLMTIATIALTLTACASTTEWTPATVTTCTHTKENYIIEVKLEDNNLYQFYDTECQCENIGHDISLKMNNDEILDYIMG